jgi:NadR type nicotinamide-nucleotide adenylyltransferase
MVKRIVAIGPESTGKSILCEKLAAHYKTAWVKEYAREYLLTNGNDYSYDDLLDIAKGQVEGEELAVGNWRLAGNDQPSMTSHQSIFIDTDMHVMQVWCEFVFDKCHHWILNQVVQRPYDLYLLCNVDLPWIKDELREYPDLETREKLYYYYKEMMINQSVPWVDISGNYEERLQKAINAVDELRFSQGV